MQIFENSKLEEGFSKILEIGKFKDFD